MNRVIVQSERPVTLVGGGPVTRGLLESARRRAPELVAADSGADRLLTLGLMPQAVIGDLDSLSNAGRAAVGEARLHHIPEQETTDFDKALRSIAAPFVLALGFAGARMDHGLAVLNALVRHRGTTCLVLGPQDVVFAAPPHLRLTLRPGDRLSLFPMAEVTGTSDGLRWPIAGLRFRPDGMIGTSNIVAEPEVSLSFDQPGMLVMLPRTRLDAALAALVPGAPAPRAVRGG
jgi:thiamine pyrophosphokinase